MLVFCFCFYDVRLIFYDILKSVGVKTGIRSDELYANVHVKAVFSEVRAQGK